MKLKNRRDGRPTKFKDHLNSIKGHQKWNLEDSVKIYTTREDAYYWLSDEYTLWLIKHSFALEQSSLPTYRYAI